MINIKSVLKSSHKYIVGILSLTLMIMLILFMVIRNSFALFKFNSFDDFIDANVVVKNSTIFGDSIFQILEQNEDLIDGEYTFSINGESYGINLYNYVGDQVFSENQSFGKAGDLATEAENAKNMVIVRVKGNLTINAGIKVTTINSNYGGTKGLTLYVTETLTNNGEISMTARGAKAVGQNVYLYKNLDNSYEYIPGVGGLGGVAVASTTLRNGTIGSIGTGRQTGGGGGGGLLNANAGSTIAASGGAGTSYSGGTGGGSLVPNTSYKTPPLKGSDIGGSGGSSSSNGLYNPLPTGGVGNPGGNASANGVGNRPEISASGTGGLLNIYAGSFVNKGTITSQGVTSTIGAATGGSSGGGSINIFINNDLTYDKVTIASTLSKAILGTTNVAGGLSVGKNANTYGGAGGAGTVNIGKIVNGKYYDLVTAITLSRQ